MAKSKSIIKATDNSLQAVGSWAFLLGVVVALIAGAFFSQAEPNPTMISFLVLLGTIVGLLNVTTKETNSFLLASVSLVLVAAISQPVVNDVVSIGPYLGSMLDSILVFVTPAAIVVALKSIFSLAESR